MASSPAVPTAAGCEANAGSKSKQPSDGLRIPCLSGSGRRVSQRWVCNRQKGKKARRADQSRGVSPELQGMQLQLRWRVEAVPPPWPAGSSEYFITLLGVPIVTRCIDRSPATWTNSLIPVLETSLGRCVKHWSLSALPCRNDQRDQSVTHPCCRLGSIACPSANEHEARQPTFCDPVGQTRQSRSEMAVS